MEKKSYNYQPLVVLLLIIFMASLALSLHEAQTSSWMHYFMGLFFLVFSMFKFFDLRGFANGFKKYDLIAKHITAYSFIYPVIELLLGLAYLSSTSLVAANLVTLILMSVSAVGVLLSMNKGLKCACLGTALNVPLSTFSAVENVGMGLMAAIMLF